MFFYQKLDYSNDVDGLIYNEYEDMYGTLKLDNYEDVDVVKDPIFDIHSNKGINETIHGSK